MLTSKQATLKPLLESKDGVHLTAYLVNRGDLIDLKTQLRSAIHEANEWLFTAMPVEERKKFLEPLEALLQDARILKQMKSNIGIFRNENLFRVLNVPIDVAWSCQVATSFHVKPLLRWLQGDQEFLFLGLENESARLYFGNQDSFKMLDSILFPDFFKTPESRNGYMCLDDDYRNKIKEAEASAWVNEWLPVLTENSKPKFFIAGEPSLARGLSRILKYQNLVRTPISESFTKDLAGELCQNIQKILKDESKKSLEKALLEFRFAEEGNRAKKNIFQISRAVVQGKVRKLIVTDELSIFGRIDYNSGGLAIHPCDLDHEDDCILDDLAQLVLSQGGEVIVAKRDEIPKGRPILAILQDDGESSEKIEEIQRETLQERYG